MENHLCPVKECWPLMRMKVWEKGVDGLGSRLKAYGCPAARLGAAAKYLALSPNLVHRQTYLEMGWPDLEAFRAWTSGEDAHSLDGTKGVWAKP